MAMIKRVLGAPVGQFTVFIFDQHVRFGDRKRSFGIDRSDEFNVGDVEFMSAIRAVINTDASGENNARLDDHALEQIKHLITERLSLSNTLNDSGRVTQNDEANLVASPGPFHPSFEFDGGVVVHPFLHIPYPNRLHHVRTVPCTLLAYVNVSLQPPAKGARA